MFKGFKIEKRIVWGHEAGARLNHLGLGGEEWILHQAHSQKNQRRFHRKQIGRRLKSQFKLSLEVRQKKVGPHEEEAAILRAVAAQEADQSQKAASNQGVETTTEIDVIDHQALTPTSEGSEGQDPHRGADTTIEEEMSTRTEGDTGMKGGGLDRLPE